jgi:hypothetical protein
MKCQDDWRGDYDCWRGGFIRLARHRFGRRNTNLILTVSVQLCRAVVVSAAPGLVKHYLCCFALLGLFWAGCWRGDPTSSPDSATPAALTSDLVD